MQNPINIFFRAKSTKTHKWVYGHYLYKPNDQCIGPGNEAHYILQYHFLDWGLHEFIQTEVDPHTVDQFIGFTDNYKTAIYVNDIVEFTFGSGHIDRYLIWHNQEGNCLTAVNLNADIHYNGQDYYNLDKFTYEDFCFLMADPWGHIDSIKVIGNLHDNPELLEV